MTLAPIGLSTYVRLDHLRQTVGALQRNPLAPSSDLYVFSDGPKAGDEEKVKAVRDFLQTVQGFRHVEILARPDNSRTYNNRQGIRALLEQFGKIIFLEEDVATAPSFLDYMNRALDTYEDNPRIFSIAAYCPPITIPADYPYDVFVFPRFDGWGFGIWKSRFDLIEMKIPARTIKNIFLNPINLYRFSLRGLDALPLALNNYFEYSDGLDVRLFTQQFALNMYTVFPIRHLVDNTGMDGSGMHPKIKPSWRVPLSEERPGSYRMPAHLEPEPEIAKRVYRFRSGNYWNRARQLIWLALIILKRVALPRKRGSLPG